jgi:hypothetical protein
LPGSRSRHADKQRPYNDPRDNDYENENDVQPIENRESKIENAARGVRAEINGPAALACWTSACAVLLGFRSRRAVKRRPYNDPRDYENDVQPIENRESKIENAARGVRAEINGTAALACGTSACAVLLAFRSRRAV